MRSKYMATILAVTMSCASANAGAEATKGERVMLQATMQQTIANSLVDGRYFYLDTQNAQVNTIYPAKTHPMILEMGEHFILCTDFRNADGEAVNVDFYISRKDGSFVVFDTVVDNRAPIERMMKAGVAKMLK